ncbi:Ig-like domain-containing protein [Enterococcus ureilyticus]|uniref:Ig-like domain-containing protein n=1 Tax=Enterococcus ureilyticus TaxID=1131292 RepID=UPI001A938468|nr:Ig-like domain-containing protein [Enterococcus ureilyticus]MBO0445188.1 Ig-like domain-containing protein [Enterococcus ureilyticus]
MKPHTTIATNTTYQNDQVKKYGYLFFCITLISCLFLLPSHSYATNLPEKSDPREQGLTTPVKTQTRGICWAYAVNSALESHLMMSGETHDFSANYFNYLLARDATGTIGENPYAHTVNSNGGNLDQGFDATPALTALLDWSGPVKETDFPNSITGAQPLTLWENLPNQKHVQNVITMESVSLDISTEENNQRVQKIKEYVHKYGNAIQRNRMYVGYETGHASQFIPKDRVGPVNHVTTIVGWDDSYSKDTFVYTPSQDGAFIVKNSWGTSWGDGGYFYISYDDFQLKRSDIDIISLVEPATNYYRKYNSALENVGSLMSISSDKTRAIANSYSRDTNVQEKLSAVSLKTLHNKTAFEIYVLPSGKPTKNLDGFVKVKEGIKNEIGTETFSLDAPVTLSGSDYSIAVAYRSLDPNNKWLPVNSKSGDKVLGDSYTLTDRGSWDKETYRNYFIAGFTNLIAEQAPSTVNSSEKNIQLIVGGSHQVTATLTPENTTYPEIGFKSSAPKIATINSDGTIHALQEGKTTIEVFSTRNPKISVAVQVTVTDKPKVDTIELNVSTLSLNRFEKATLTAKTLPENAQPETIIWKSENPLIATVDTNGVIKGQGTGTGKIFAMTSDGRIKAECVVTIAPNTYSGGFTSLEMATDLRNNQRSYLYIDDPLNETIYLRYGKGSMLNSKNNWAEFHLTTPTGKKLSLLDYPIISWYNLSETKQFEPNIVIEYSTDGTNFSLKKPDLQDLEGFRISLDAKITERILLYADLKMKADNLQPEDKKRRYLPLKITSGDTLYGPSVKTLSDGETENWATVWNLYFAK